MIENLFYYFLFSSMVLVHGLGFTWGVLQSENIHDIPLNLMKNLICVSATSVLTSLVVRGLFLPIHMQDLMPLAVVLIYAVISPFFEALIRITAKQNAAELQVPLLCVIFAQTLTSSAMTALVWTLVALISYYALLILIHGLRKRLNLANSGVYFSGAPVMLLSLAAVVLLVYFAGISWMSTGLPGVEEIP